MPCSCWIRQDRGMVFLNEFDGVRNVIFSGCGTWRINFEFHKDKEKVCDGGRGFFGADKCFSVFFGVCGMKKLGIHPKRGLCDLGWGWRTEEPGAFGLVGDVAIWDWLEVRTFGWIVLSSCWVWMMGELNVVEWSEGDGGRSGFDYGKIILWVIFAVGRRERIEEYQDKNQERGIIRWRAVDGNVVHGNQWNKAKRNIDGSEQLQLEVAWFLLNVVFL